MWFDRDSSSKIVEIARQFPVLVLTGARQTGKTSLLRRLFPDHRFVSLDLPSHAEMAEQTPGAFFDAFPPPVLVDEVQYAPALFRHVKALVDGDRRARGRFIFTGSQKFVLMKEVSESLAGRAAILELETLSQDEIARRRPLGDLDAVVLGGFPELASEPDRDRQVFFASYLATYIERDVRSLLRVAHLRDFERFVRALALRTGQILNKSDLARDVGVSAPTANEWLSVLQTSGVAVLLEPWFANRTRSLVKSPKAFLADSGLACFLLGIDTVPQLLASPLLGALWETFVFAELRKRMAFARGSWDLWFWRDLRGTEIDFLVHRGGRYRLMEAKVTERPSPDDAAGLDKVAAALGSDRVERAEILCRVAAPHLVRSRAGLKVRALRIGSWKEG